MGDPVQGVSKDGTTQAPPSVTVGGKDSTGAVRTLLTGTDGTLQVSSSGGGGGAVTIADGADVAQGTTTDLSTANTVIGRLKKLISLLPTALGQTTMSASLPVVIASDQSAVAVNDPGLPDTLGIKTAAGSTSITLASDGALPLPSGAATSALQTTMSGNQTNGTQQSKITDGTDIADVITGDSGNNGLVVASSRKEVTGTTSTNTAICSTDVSNYSYVCVQFTAAGGSATNAFQSSNDNTNWVNSPLVRATQLNNAATASGTTADLYFGILPGRYFRINVTGIVSGSTTAVVEFSTIPRMLHTMGVSAAQSGTWTFSGAKTNNNAAPGATNLGALVALANAATPSWTEGNEVLLSTDLLGNLRVWNGTSPAGTALNTSANRITSNTTTTPTAATAYISSIVITTEVGGTTSTVTIQSKEATPKILVNGVTTTAASLAPTVINFQTPVKMTSGIDIITAGAVAGTVDIWVNYYQ